MIAIVTGASSGIGAEFCRALDHRGLESIWLIARRADRLESLADELSTPCTVIPADLTTHEGIRSVLDRIESSGCGIGYLVNCAGMGRFGDTWEVSDRDTETMIDLNVTALTRITRACIPHMSAGSGIVEVCSASAYLPLRHLNVYAATKAYVKAFCDGLRRELRDKDIGVLEVSPGWVETDFIALSESGTSVPGRVFKHTVTREEVVAQAMRDLDRGRRRSVCGCYNRFQVFACTHMPRVATYVWERSLR